MSRGIRHGVAVFVLLAACRAFSAENAGEIEPFWTLLHEPAVVDELKLSAGQRRQYQTMLDALDVRFFPLRNKSREEAEAGSLKLVREAKDELSTLLNSQQSQRLAELVRRRVGIFSILQNDVADKLGYSSAQRQKLETVLKETRQTMSDLEQRVQAGEAREPLEKKFKDAQLAGQKKALQILKPGQQAAWQELLGAAFDASRLERAKYKVPELVDTDGWINSRGEPLERLRGKVVVLHFYACGCINCIRNYPHYRDWHERFAGDDFALIGIHTPETDAERDLSHVRKKAAEEKLTFPILLDGHSRNWDNFGNSMWPSVYVLDKEGYLRHFWPGELNWQGNEGEKFLRERIAALLEEPGKPRGK
jgi:peroxiredoxin